MKISEREEERGRDERVGWSDPKKEKKIEGQREKEREGERERFGGGFNCFPMMLRGGLRAQSVGAESCWRAYRPGNHA